MRANLWQIFKHISATTLLLLSAAAEADRVTIDLLQDAASTWSTSTPSQWQFVDGNIVGASKLFDGDKTDPAASTFLVSKQVFGGNIDVSVEISFEVGRYLGLYLDFDQQSQSGIWMATGHALAADAADNEVERGYVKTVENGFWIVRATGELVIEGDEVVRLRFSRQGADYSMFQEDRLIATYRKSGGYEAGPIQLRLTNSRARIRHIQVQSDWVR